MARKAIDEDQIRTAAYYLWLEEGQPQGLDADHWMRARAQLESSTGSAKAANAPAKAKTADRTAKPKAVKSATVDAKAAKPARQSKSTKAKA